MTDRLAGQNDRGGSRLTFHLAPRPVWEALASDAPYLPERFADEGFVHTTLGADNLLDVANRYYRGDPRPYCALIVDLDWIAAPWRFDEAGPRYPHIYGPIDRAAVVGVVPVERDATGAFIAVGADRSQPGS